MRAHVNAREPFGVYVHVPFCAHACDFCAFYQIEPRREEIENFLEAVEAEFRLVTPLACDTAYWGGGTPSVLPARDLARLGAAQLARFGRPRLEWTVEVAPGSARPETLRALRELGVTRISLGVQSFSARTLEQLGRRHSPEQIRRAWDAIRGAGFASANLDMIFAVPGQTLADWRSDLEDAVRLRPDHISTYCLTLEDDTALLARLAAVGRSAIDPERERLFYEATWDQLGEAGFAQYEISNHAQPGHACVHNVHTWRMHSWAGFGPSAASQLEGRRGSNPADLAGWAQAVRAGRRAGVQSERLSRAQMVEDALIFGLRMNEGVDLRALETRFGRVALQSFRGILDELARDQLAEWRDADRIVLTRAGRLLADAVGQELLGVAAGAPP